MSEPLADFIRFEYDITAGLNIAAGERVRWLPRRQASDLCLPGNDFWVFDNRFVRFSHFAGNGDFLEDELSDIPAVVDMCPARSRRYGNAPSRTPSTVLPDHHPDLG